MSIMLWVTGQVWPYVCQRSEAVERAVLRQLLFFLKSSYLDNNLSLNIHSSYTLGSLTSDHWVGVRGGARGQNLELPKYCFSSTTQRA